MRLLGGRGRFLGLSFPYCPVDKNFNVDERGGYSGHGYDKDDISCGDGNGRRNIRHDDGDLRGDIIFDDGRRGSRSKDTSHFYYLNME